MDNFYMLWQRKSSVFTGEFACCSLGHKRTGRDGTEMAVTCDDLCSGFGTTVVGMEFQPPFAGRCRSEHALTFSGHVECIVATFIDTQCRPSIQRDVPHFS